MNGRTICNVVTSLFISISKNHGLVYAEFPVSIHIHRSRLIYSMLTSTILDYVYPISFQTKHRMNHGFDAPAFSWTSPNEASSSSSRRVISSTTNIQSVAMSRKENGRRHTLAKDLCRYTIEFVLQLVEEFIDSGGEFGCTCGGFCWCLRWDFSQYGFLKDWV